MAPQSGVGQSLAHDEPRLAELKTVLVPAVSKTSLVQQKPTCLSCPAEALISAQEKSLLGGTEDAQWGTVGYRDVWIHFVS